ncbi:MAG TPA: hypothetical protein VGI56_02455 [Galbitalea sp.]|jgi:hypothetical protein
MGHALAEQAVGISVTANSRGRRRIGGYVLPGDTVWLERTIRQYYPLLDELVVPVPDNQLGWTGVPIPVDEALAVIRAADTRGILRVISGRWTDKDNPMRADTAQRQAAVDALSDTVDWILQIDNDEFLPHPERLEEALDDADRRGIAALEWPMRVLYRRTRRHVFEVVTRNGGHRYDYPGPIAVRAGVQLTDARRTSGDFLRLLVEGDAGSLQVNRRPEPGEHRLGYLTHDQAIVHNSWARDPAAMRQKLSSWGHARKGGFNDYYWLKWWPSPLLWRLQRDLHPFAKGLWPALRPRANDGELAD